ncbi:maleylpyruvate isomerase family mycothiol-dependent enzyme [Paractinoplanes maris]|uniref:maleylpyruvate isomerase family mycothiol-dependent enzyme n=1 Tax=Paractinoplanes maris TaxID=1734446 RepID=UPI0020207118|nr:maleylpyruvate isomerase family mycothiol-dependent enzyme [Actinoplanes maris]
MDDTEVWSAVDRRRRVIVELLTGLAPAEWDTPSLCEAWTVRDVAAHLTMPLLTLRQLALLAIRHPGGTNRLIREGSIDLARRHDPGQLVHRLGLLIGRHRAFPGLTCRESLIDAVGHTFDMAIPLGLEIRVPAAEVAEAADRVVSYRGRGNAKVFRSLPLTTFRLNATDYNWSTGNGAQVAGTMTDLFLLLTGRAVRIGHVHGPGADALRHAVAS